MKTELVNDEFNLKYFDGLIQEFIKENDGNGFGKEMSIAILPPIEPSKYLNPVRPYRTIDTIGLKEFFSTAQFLEGHGLICINKDADSIDGFDCVFFIPEDEFIEIYPESDPDYENKLAALRAMFRKG